MPAPLDHAGERLDAPVKLLSARLWAGFAALAVAVAATGAWGAVGTLPQHVSASGVILHGADAVSVRAPVAGSLASVAVAQGSPVRRGQLLATLAAGSRRVALRAPAAGTVMSLLAAPGREVEPGAPVLALDPVARPARAVLFVTSTRVLARLAPGQRVDLGGATYGQGRIRSVTPYRASAADLVARFGSARVPGAPRGAWLVDVALDGGAPPAPALAPVSASVLVDRVHPYQLVFGGSR